ncbi:MAG: BON domain-containing protein [Steroidobacteraceae bacterium]
MLLVWSRPVNRGLFPALFLAAIALASCSATPRAPKQIIADRAITQHLYLALNSDPYHYFRHVNVRVDDGVAILSGYVWTPDALYRARQIARGIPGVTRVVTSDLEQELEGRGNGRTR